MKQLLKFLIKIFFYPVKFKGSKIKSWIPSSVKIGKNVIIEKNCLVGNEIGIGDYTYIGENTRIESNTESIGKFCSIAPDVKIGVGPHPVHYFSTSPVFYSKGRGFVKEELFDEYKYSGFAVIENDVWIGANAVIIAGVKIGNGAVIAAGAVVTKDVPPYAIAGGVPAKIIKFRFEPELIKKILESRWWEKDLELLLKNIEYIDDPERFLKNL
jgi:acetyltransferase-like isoleucine patch superfamily enzyme